LPVVEIGVVGGVVSDAEVAVLSGALRAVLGDAEQVEDGVLLTREGGASGGGR